VASEPGGPEGPRDIHARSVPVPPGPSTFLSSPATSQTLPLNPHHVVDGLRTSPTFQALLRSPLTGGRVLTVTGNVGSSGAAVLAALYRELPRHLFVAVADDPDQAARLEADLLALLDGEAVPLYPQSESRFYSPEEDPRIGGLRVEAVEALFGGSARLFVTTPRALQERVALPDRLARLRLELEAGEEIGFQLLAEELDNLGYERVSLVEEVGQYAVRGGILDIFSLGLPDPVRLEFWGDEITSIRRFDVTDQRSTGTEERVTLLPARFRSGEEDGGQSTRSLLEILPEGAVLVQFGAEEWDEAFRRCEAQAHQIRRDREEGGERLPDPERILLPAAQAREGAERRPRLRLVVDGPGELNLRASPPPQVERRMDRLKEFLEGESRRGATTVILCDNEGQVERLEEILSERGRLPPGLSVGVGTVEGGFLLPEASPPLNVLTDHEIFRRGRRVRSGRRFKGSVALESLAQLAPGDYVVHMDHGIGRFRGLEQIEVGGEALEVLAVEYAGGEILRVPVYRLDLVERWIGETDGTEPPSVHRIGGKRWKTLKRKTEEAIRRMTQELLELYAERELAEGFAFSPDTKWQREMEASFLYEDTPDQARVTAEVKKDMESPKPMDRLICGDVGFGKTEVAIRAAFKAVQDGKQVAVLAPTTILVEQHCRTFEERLADFPVKVAALSRFRSQREQEEILAALERGEVDMVIGTHRLLSPDVRFQSLGLLVVDEEQRFGVKHKERLKKLRASVDVLTLTATPIPRTLQLSLGGCGTSPSSGPPPGTAWPSTPRASPGATVSWRRSWPRSWTGAARSTSSTTGWRPSTPSPSGCAAWPRRPGGGGPRPDAARRAGPGDAGLHPGGDRHPGLLLHRGERPGRPQRQHPHRGPRRPLRAGPALPDPGAGGTLGPAGPLLPGGARRDHRRGEAAPPGPGALHRAGERVPGGPP
jgi:transcription-repair coupling factor (superfamily II helicase)